MSTKSNHTSRLLCMHNKSFPSPWLSAKFFMMVHSMHPGPQPMRARVHSGHLSQILSWRDDHSTWIQWGFVVKEIKQYRQWDMHFWCHNYFITFCKYSDQSYTTYSLPLLAYYILCLHLFRKELILDLNLVPELVNFFPNLLLTV